MSRGTPRGSILIQSLGVTLVALLVILGVLAFVWVLGA
jgi:hypothetical protein